MDLRLTVENKPLPASWILGLHVVIVDLQRGVGAGTCQTDNVVLAVIDFDGHFAQTVVVRPDIIRGVQMAVPL